MNIANFELRLMLLIILMKQFSS